MVNLARFCRCVAVQPVCISSLSSNHHLSFLFTASRVRFDSERYGDDVELTIVAARSFLSFTVVFQAFNSLDIHSFLPSTHLFNHSTTHFCIDNAFLFVCFCFVRCGWSCSRRSPQGSGRHEFDRTRCSSTLLLALYAQADLLLIIACVFT
jgi:hypothetical protein